MSQPIIMESILKPYLGSQFGKTVAEGLKKNPSFLQKVNRALTTSESEGLAEVLQSGITYGTEDVSLGELAVAFTNATKHQFDVSQSRVQNILFDREWGLVNNLLLNPPVLLRDGDSLELISARHRMLAVFTVSSFLNSLSWEDREELTLSCIVYTIDRKSLAARFPDSFESKIMRYKAALTLSFNGGKGTLSSRESTSAESEAMIESQIGIVSGDVSSYGRAFLRYLITKDKDLKFDAQSIFVRILKDAWAQRSLPKSVNGEILPNTATPSLKSIKLGDPLTQKGLEYSGNLAWVLKSWKGLHKVLLDESLFGTNELPGTKKKEKQADGKKIEVVTHPSRYAPMLSGRIAYIKDDKLEYRAVSSIPKTNEYDAEDYGLSLDGIQEIISELMLERPASYWSQLRANVNSMPGVFKWLGQVPEKLFAQYANFNFFDVASEVTLESPIYQKSKEGAVSTDLKPIQISRYREAEYLEVMSELLYMMGIEPSLPASDDSSSDEFGSDDSGSDDSGSDFAWTDWA